MIHCGFNGGEQKSVQSQTLARFTVVAITLSRVAQKRPSCCRLEACGQPTVRTVHTQLAPEAFTHTQHAHSQFAHHHHHHPLSPLPPPPHTLPVPPPPTTTTTNPLPSLSHTHIHTRTHARTQARARTHTHTHTHPVPPPSLYLPYPLTHTLSGRAADRLGPGRHTAV